MQANNKKPKKLKKIKGSSLLPLIVDQNEGEARQLLKKYDQPQPKDPEEVAYKLAELYTKTTDKKTLEKEFAEIHPHRKFILDRLAPKPEVKVPETPSEVNQKNREFIMADANRFSNCAGNSNCPCSAKFSNACGCGSSSFDAKRPEYSVQKSGSDESRHIQTTLMLIGTITLSAIATIMIINTVRAANKG